MVFTFLWIIDFLTIDFFLGFGLFKSGYVVE